MTSRADTVRDASRCPFCPGHESDAEAAVEERFDDDGAWMARAFPNRYPMTCEVAPEPRREGFFRERNAAGRHEVVVESPRHDADLSDLTVDALATVLGLYRARHRALAALDDVRCVLLFKNRGPRAGASLRHPHGQLVANAVVPSLVRRRDAVAARYHRRHGASVVRAAVEAELEAGTRVVASRDGFVTLCPYASSRSFETWVVPPAAWGNFGATPDDALVPLASMLGETLRRVRHATGDADYNLLLREPAVRAWGGPWAQWYFEVQVRRGGDAGFELNGGMPCAVIGPEECAEALRSADVL